MRKKLLITSAIIILYYYYIYIRNIYIRLLQTILYEFMLPILVQINAIYKEKYVKIFP